MSTTSVLLLTGLTGLVSLGYVAFGLDVARRYEGIGVLSLAAFAVLWGVHFLLNAVVIAVLAVNGVTSGADLGSLSVPPNLELFLLSTTPISGLLTVAAIFGWLWFVLGYTTRLDRLDKVSIVGLGVVVFLTASLNSAIGALSSLGYITLSPAFENQIHDFGSTVEILGTSIAIGGGAAQLYRAARRHAPFAHEAVVGLTLPVLLPYLVRYLYQFGLVVAFDAIELLRGGGLAVGLVGLFVSVRRYDVFEQLPASQVVGRDTAFESTRTPMILLDAEDRIADINRAAGSLFEVSTADIIGNPLDSVLPRTVAPDEFCAAGRTTFEFPNSNRVIECQATVTTDETGREIGRAVVCNDLTDERRRQQRIQVLNRALRHNLRNDLTVAKGYVEIVAERNDAEAEHVARAIETLDEIATLGDKAREIERILAVDVDGVEATSLADIVADAIDDVRSDHEVSVVTSVPDDVFVAVTPTVLQSVLRELIENSVVHTDGADVRVSFRPDAEAVVVSDAGPGIPEYETSVLELERETSLQHGSGLGLWLVKWGVDRFGGTVQFDGDGDGTDAVVSIPADRITRGAS